MNFTNNFRIIQKPFRPKFHSPTHKSGFELEIIKKFNLYLLILPILIFSLSYMTLLSTSPSKVGVHVIFFITGYILYLIISSIDYKYYKIQWKLVYIFALITLVVTYLLGEIRFGSSRWIDIGFFTFQPSEFAKFALIISNAALITKNKYTLRNIGSITKIVIPTFLIFVLILKQPDLGSAVVIAATFAFMLFYAGLNKYYFLIAFVSFGLLSAPIWRSLKTYQKERVLVFLNPQLDKLGSGYNVNQSMIAVGSGGFKGKGYGNGSQTHLNFLPAYETDFIFSAFAEEWGFIGSLLFLIFYSGLLLNIALSVFKSTNPYGTLIIVGIFITFFLQFLVNIGMNIGIMPVKGIPLPFFSYGGSSMLSSFVLLGLVQSVNIHD